MFTPHTCDTCEWLTRDACRGLVDGRWARASSVTAIVARPVPFESEHVGAAVQCGLADDREAGAQQHSPGAMIVHCGGRVQALEAVDGAGQVASAADSSVARPRFAKSRPMRKPISASPSEM